MTETAKQPLTEKQQAILDFIVEHTQSASPTSREIQRAFSFRSPHSVTGHLDALERLGRIRRIAGRSRNIEVIA